LTHIGLLLWILGSEYQAKMVSSAVIRTKLTAKPTTFTPQTELFLFYTLADNIMHFLVGGYQTKVNAKFHAEMLSTNTITAGIMVCNSMVFDGDCRQIR